MRMSEASFLGFLPGPGGPSNPIPNLPPNQPCIDTPLGRVCFPLPEVPLPTPNQPMPPGLPPVPQPPAGPSPFPPVVVTGCNSPVATNQLGQMCCPPGHKVSTRRDPRTGQVTTCCVKRRRMNPLNPKALSRATRRLSGFTRRVKAVEKQLRKLAPPSRRRAPSRKNCGC